ncbi:mRNA capping enzyme [Fadolivirus algeromassiliense]|jgi:SAM-dependent methyltransferase|uniref:mRNA capping enzyme n=1 Tax=Fadolivirus FV1/VV64 TaxID=3070911 RepID=A0A7D3V5A0_9VIRU|nr:mRNA capping enzyme [Fadolivirus algeromassiliense]QKF93755.1 mRNA capping enzyme [Fadolivirus FV1/VV64]
MSTIEKYRISGSFADQLDKNVIKAIDDLYKKISSESEFEIMFFNYKKEQNRMGLEHFLKILEYLTHKSKKNNFKLVSNDTLDIAYSKKSGEIFRITIDGIDSINKYIKMLHMRKNHVIFSVLTGLVEKDKTLHLMKKIREKENVIDINDFDIRFRLSEETQVSKKEIDELKKLDYTIRNEITFRYKQRISLILEDSKDAKIAIDLTNIKMTKNINELESSVPIYELEIDLSSKNKNPDRKYLDKIFTEISTLLKIQQQSNFVISRSLENEVLDSYINMLGIKKESMTALEGRKAQSLEVQHVVDQLPNKYAVTDKADGERYVLIIYKNAVFLISDLLNVKSTGIILPESKNSYNNTILDGELIFIQSQNRYIYMSFDCLYKGGNDIRQIAELQERHKHIDDVIENCFTQKNHKGFKFEDYKGKFESKEILKFHETKIKQFIDALNYDIVIDKQTILIRRKYFISVTGAQNNEIFKYSTLMWDKFTKDKSINCPYILDGLIYHPLNQKYVVSVRESKFLEYKWKPEEKNSIDFYVQYERSKDTNKIVTLYDNSREEDDQIRGKPYKILKLYVGKTMRGLEQPVLFEPETDSVKYLAYMFLQDGEVRDIQGNIIQDNTVVEFYYNNDPNIPDKHRWVPIRTRFDKTESVQRFGKKYGNYVDIAYKVWRSIRNPFTMNDINLLSKDEVYDKHIDILRGKIDHSVILSENKENVYYQIRTTLGKPMRNFHNWIKSILIYTHVNSMYEQDNKKLTILDIACGRGGDIMKYYYGEVDFMVGIDIDNNGLISPIDGALSRYNQFKKTHPNFPRMWFVHADGGVLLNYEDQTKALGGMSDKNKELINKFFSVDPSKRTLFDRMVCQFAIHYFFENETIFSNFTQNVKDYLKPGGYLIATTFDADRIMELFKEKDQYTQYYTNNNGEQNVLFEIKKKYENIKQGDEVGVGVAIDFHNAIDFQEGTYKTEYLVQKKFIEKEFLERCDLELVDTDLFENQYIMHKDFFNNVYKAESKDETRKFLTNVAEYFTQKSDINSACYNLTRLYRYFVFRKKDSNVAEKPKKQQEQKQQKKPAKKITKQKGGNPINEDNNEITNDYTFNDVTDKFNPTKFVKRDVDGISNYSFFSSVHDILRNHKVIPNNLSMMEFYNDISYDICPDDAVDKNKIMEMNKSLIIKHDYAESDLSSEMALDGLNTLIVKKDCDDKTVIDRIGKNNKFMAKTPTIILYNDGNKYHPIYKVKNDTLVGIYDSSDKFIQDLLK